MVMYSIFLVIFDKRVLLFNFKIKPLKIRNCVQVYAITKYPFTYFSLIEIIRFFSDVSFLINCFLAYQKYDGKNIKINVI